MARPRPSTANALFQRLDVRRWLAVRWTGVLRCLLLVAVWQGPIPWCHCHAAESAPQLARHLRSHHAGHDPFGHRDCWHLHIILPDSPAQTPGDSSGDHYQRLPMLSSADAASHAADCAAMQGSWIPLAQVLEVSTSDLSGLSCREGSARAHFYDGFAADLSLPERFCVARC